jgi:hypothetical protein
MLTRFIAFRVRLKTPYAIYNKLTTLFHPPLPIPKRAGWDNTLYN